MDIKDIIREARTKAGFTQEQAAEEIMVTRQTISNWENGKSLPDIISVLKMSDFYQISLDELLKGDKKMVEKIEQDEKDRKRERRTFVISILVIIMGCISNLFTVFRISSNYDSKYRLFVSYITDISVILIGMCGLGILFSTKYYGKSNNRVCSILLLLISVILLAVGIVCIGTVFTMKGINDVTIICCGVATTIIAIVVFKEYVKLNKRIIKE